MAHVDLHDIKKQASLFFREKFKDARLAFTDVSRIQLLTEEATNVDSWGPETRTLAVLSEAAFELQEYERIVQVLCSRLESATKKPWRQIYKTLVVLEYLLTHGPASFVKEFRSSEDLFEDLCQFSFIDQQGIDRGLSVRKKADRVLELLNATEVWQEERSRAQKISHGIHGFGSSIDRKPHGAKNGEMTFQNTKSKDSESLEDPESHFLLSNEEEGDDGQDEVDIAKNHGNDWQPFWKCQSISTHLRHSNGSQNNSQESNISRPKFETTGKFYKKCLSSPGFRDTIEWQPFAEGNESETIVGGLKNVHSGLAQDNVTDAVTAAHLQNPCPVGKPTHHSVRQFLGLQRSVDLFIKTDPHESSLIPKQSNIGISVNDDAESKISSDVTNMAVVFRPVNRACMQNSSATLPTLPPPPRPKFLAQNSGQRSTTCGSQQV